MLAMLLSFVALLVPLYFFGRSFWLISDTIFSLRRRRLILIILTILIVLGGILNWVIVGANGGKMPVDDPSTQITPNVDLDWRHQHWEDGMKLHFFCDRFCFSFLGYVCAFSVGDILIYSGFGLMIVLMVISLIVPSIISLRQFFQDIEKLEKPQNSFF